MQAKPPAGMALGDTARTLGPLTTHLSHTWSISAGKLPGSGGQGEPQGHPTAALPKEAWEISSFPHPTSHPFLLGQSS